MNLYSFFEQLDIELAVVISFQNPYYKGFCFLLDFFWLKSLVTKQKLKEK